MPDQLLWVLLPIGLAGAWLAWCALRGRLPSRPVLNAWFSVLLLIYVLCTAGLGIFWVANQHLPVFDWHYVFGYALLVLLAVHLGFNARTLWRQLRRRPAGAESHAPVAGLGRRPVLGALGGLGALGAAAIGGAAFFLGLRQGRTEWRVVTGSSPMPASDAALAVVERFHAQSAQSRGGILRRAPSPDWGAPPPPFKIDAGRAQVTLDRPGEAAAPLPPGAALGPQTLAALLWHTAGVSEWRGGIAFRAAPSAGALFATELYVAARAVEGLRPGWYHYRADRHALVPLRDGPPAVDEVPESAAASIWATAIFRRTGVKYGDRAYRYVLADLGHALENLRAAAHACAVDVAFEPAFDEARVASRLGVDESEEGVLAQAVLRVAARVEPAGRRADERPVRPSARMLPWQAAAPSAASASSGSVTEAVHRATSLRAASAVPEAAAPGASAGPAPPLVTQTLPAPELPAQPARSVWTVIARRRSRRRFSPRALALADVSAILAAMVAPAPQLSGAARIDLLSCAVEGLAPGVWRYDPVAHALQGRGPVDDARTLRKRAQAAALDQEVIGAAAAVFVLSIARAAWAADPLGPARGYRHAYLEAGMFGERVYLAAGARGLGVCAVGAFFDDEAAALAQIDPRQEWVVHLVALGRLD